MSCAEIAEMYDVTKTTVATMIKRLGVSRTNSETWNLPGRHKPLATKEWLYQKYWVEEKSMVDISKMLNRDIKTILYWMRKYDIQTRPRGHTWKTNLQQGQPKGFRHTEETKRKVGKASRDRGAVPYLRNGEHWLKTVEPEKNPNWKGGITPERQSFQRSDEWKKVANQIWKRDNATCQRCGLKYKYRKTDKFHIHHIVSFMIQELRLEPTNLILLCPDCHHWVHSNENTEKEFIKEL